jgi:hypothetical protein
MSDKIKFKHYDVSKGSYETYEKDYRFSVGFEYDPEDHTVCGPILNYLNPYRKLRKGISYFRDNNKNSIISRCSAINLSVVIPVILWELEQKNIKATVSWTENQALIISFPNEAEHTLFMFRFHDIFGTI